MHETIRQQPPLVAAAISHVHARELKQVSEVLDRLSEAAALVHADLLGAGRATCKDRTGLSADQILRALIIEQMNGFSYEELAFHLADSTCCRWFREGQPGRSPSRALHVIAPKEAPPATSAGVACELLRQRGLKTLSFESGAGHTRR